MKKSIISILMVLVLIVSFAACKKIPDDVYVETPTNENGEIETTIPAELEDFLSSFDTSDPAEIQQQFEQMLDSETVEVELEFGDELIDDSSAETIDVVLNEKGEPDRSEIQNNYKEIAEGDTLTMDIVLRQTRNGEELVAPIYTTRDGDKVYMSATVPYENKGTMTVSALSMGDGNLYMIIPSMRAYILATEEEIGELDFGEIFSQDFTDVESDAVYVETKKVDVNGKSYSCDIYEDDGIITKYYYSEDALKRVETVDGENVTIMEFNTISAEADSSKFKVPSNYFDMTSILTSGAAMASAAS